MKKQPKLEPLRACGQPSTTVLYLGWTVTILSSTSILVEKSECHHFRETRNRWHLIFHIRKLTYREKSWIKSRTKSNLQPHVISHYFRFV